MMVSRRLLVGVALLLVVTGSSLSVPVTEGRALSAEEMYIADRLENASCLTDWGTSEGARPRKQAAVTKLTAFGYRISVTIPYAYTTESNGETIYADTASGAIYEITLTDTRRIRGDEISPC